jgi:hypothetical protein
MLKALVTNGMAESKQKLATLSDVQEEDFARFFQFAYTGDYSAPLYIIDESASDDGIGSQPEEKVVTDAESERGSPEEFARVRLKDRRRRVAIPQDPDVEKRFPSRPMYQKWGPEWIAWKVDDYPINLSFKFENKRFYTDLPRKELFDACEPTSNTSPKQDFTPVFLAHARLYEFAERYMITTLKHLVLQKLHQTLLRFEIHVNRVRDIVELVRFAYSNDHTSNVEELRVLVTVYVASEFEVIRSSEEFETLLQEGGPFVLYLLRLLENRVYQKSLRDYE